MKKQPKVAAALISIVIIGLPFVGGSCKVVKEIAEVSEASKVVKEIAEVPKAKKAGLSVFSSLGDNEDDFIRIYKRAPTPGERKYIGNATKEFKELKLAHSLDGSKEGFLRYIRMTKENLILVTGHNEAGIFHFTDGKTLPLDEMARLIKQEGKEHCFISCMARKYVDGPAAESIISQTETVNVIMDIDKLLQRRIGKLEKLLQQPEQSLKTLDGQGDETVEVVLVPDSEELAIQAQINKSIQIARRKPKVKYVVTTGTIGGGLVILKMIDGKD